MVSQRIMKLECGLTSPWGDHQESLNRLVSEHAGSVRSKPSLPGSWSHFIPGRVSRRSGGLALQESIEESEYRKVNVHAVKS